MRDDDIYAMVSQYESDDGLEDDDDSIENPDFQPLEDVEHDALSDDNDDDSGNEDNGAIKPIAGPASAEPETSQSKPGPSQQNKKKKKQAKRNLQWRKRNLVLSA